MFANSYFSLDPNIEHMMKDSLRRDFENNMKKAESKWQKEALAKAAQEFSSFNANYSFSLPNFKI